MSRVASSRLVDEVRLSVSEADAVTFRNNVGLAYHQDGSATPYGIGGKGGADLIGIAPWVSEHGPLGLFMAIEVKSGRGRLTQEQRQFLEMIALRRGVAIEARTPEGVADLLNRLRNGEPLFGKVVTV